MKLHANARACPDGRRLLVDRVCDQSRAADVDQTETNQPTFSARSATATEKAAQTRAIDFPTSGFREVSGFLSAELPSLLRYVSCMCRAMRDS